MGGELFVSPRPAAPHAIASTAVTGELMPPFQFGRNGPGGWWFMIEPELHLASDVLVPDLAGWRRTRMPTPPRTAAIELAPDFLCEVLSPSTATFDRTHKLASYARAGVQHVWLVDPLARTLEVLRLDGPSWRVAGNFGDLQRVRAEPFEAIELELALWWGDASPG